MTVLDLPQTAQRLDERLLANLTDPQRTAVVHEGGPLLVVAGAGTGKTTVITRRIAWLLATQRAQPREILALTFTDKAAGEMEERVDLLLPYGCTSVAVSTFHAFGDRLLRDHALESGVSLQVRVLSKPEQLAFLRAHLFELPLERFRPLVDPARYVEALITVIGRAKDEAVTPEAFLDFAQTLGAQAAADTGDERLQTHAAIVREVAQCYEGYQRLLRATTAIDFGDQVLLAIRLLEQHPDLLETYRGRFRHILVDEFQDTNYAQFRLLQLLAPPDAHIMVVADDDQSIYKWRGAAISNVVKFLEHYHRVRRIVLTQNFRSSQPILDHAYRLIRGNDPDRLEVKEGIDKRLVAMRPREPRKPLLSVFDTASSEADWVARQIQAQVESGRRRPGDHAILVRTNREADLFLRALNVCGIPWQFSGTTGLFGHEDVKMLMSCLKTLADPDDSLSWYHVVSSDLYLCPMADLITCLALANRTNVSVRIIFERVGRKSDDQLELTEEARKTIEAFLADVHRFMELSRTHSPGQLLYRWLADTGWLKRHAALERSGDAERLQAVASFFDQLYRFEPLIGNRLPELMRSLEFFEAVAETSGGDPEPSSGDRVSVLTIHKAKGLEFPVVFLVGLVQGRFPTLLRHDPIELPDPLIKDLLPSGDYHLQEERRLFYVGMTRAMEELYLTAAYHYGGKSVRKLSPFVLEALALPSPSPTPRQPSDLERIARAIPAAPSPKPPGPASLPEPLRLDPHGVDDYLTCPLKFRYSHILRIPIMRHHLVVYGAALHKAVELFFKRLLLGSMMSEAELLQVFEQAWSSEGFLTRQHEELRLAQGKEVLRRFWAWQQAAPERPLLVEEKFSVHLDDLVVVGRWDRVDRRPDGNVVIVDYKSSEIHEQTQADRRTKQSVQMAMYALAWQMIHGQLPHHVELRFLETGVVGQAAVTEENMEETKDLIRDAAKGIRALDFHAEPKEFVCRWCAYQSICPSAISS